MMHTSQEIRERLAYLFRYFGEQQCGNHSPFYANLAMQVAEDAELLELASMTPHGQWVQNLFFSAVHDLLLQGIEHPLRDYYPSLTATPNQGNPFPALRAFCLEYRNEIHELLVTRKVQTNEIGRSALLVPAFNMVYWKTGKPLALVDVGASAGLNLLFDRYGYSYGAWHPCGDQSSPLQLSCELRGEWQPFLPRKLPLVAARIGIDLNPMDVHNHDDVRWLRALMWPDQPERMQALDTAIALAQPNPAELLEGDVFEVLPEVLAAAPPDTTVCVYHSFVLTQFSAENRVRYDNLLREFSHQRELYCISLELMGSPVGELTLSNYHKGTKESAFLATCDPYGCYLEWVN